MHTGLLILLVTANWDTNPMGTANGILILLVTANWDSNPIGYCQLG